MKLNIIVAAADNGVIGVNNTLPWRLPDDLKQFKALTMGKPVLMGRKTWDSLGRPLPGRRNVVISRQTGLTLAGAEVQPSLDAAIAAVSAADEAFVIGGAEIYRQALPLAQRVYLTEVRAQIAGDAFFPPLDGQWKMESRTDHEADERHAYAFGFVTYTRLADQQEAAGKQ